MDVTKASAQPPPAMSPGDPLPDPPPNAPAAGSALVGRVDIQPLDDLAALQIMISEVCAEFGLGAASSPVQSQAHAAHAMMTLWLQAAAASEPGLRSALDRGFDVVSGWQNVPQGALDAANEIRALVLSLICELPPSSTWRRPEWLALKPRMEQFWKRRRNLGTTDPDEWTLPDDTARDPSVRAGADDDQGDR